MFVLHVGLLALIHPLAEPSLPAHPRYRATDTPAGDAIASETIYAMHKPRGVVSAVRDPDPHRRTLTDVMVAAGVPPLTAHVGRLDAETSGLLLLTSHPLLLRAIVGQPEVLEPFGGQPLPKVYTLLLAGRHAVDSVPIASLSEPLSFERSERTIEAEGARLLSVESFRDEALAAGEYRFCGRDDAERVAAERSALRSALAAPIRSRATGAMIAAHVPHGGWLTLVTLEISQGRHHQVRRLCRRARLKLRHLTRVSVGSIALGELPPGGVRVLTRAERAELYESCLPRLVASQRGRAEKRQ